MKRIIICFVVILMNSPLVSQVITWGANTEMDLAGYKVYFGTKSRNYIGLKDVANTTEVTVNSLDNIVDGIWFFAVTAYDTIQNESDYSDEVWIDMDADEWGYTKNGTPSDTVINPVVEFFKNGGAYFDENDNSYHINGMGGDNPSGFYALNPGIGKFIIGFGYRLIGYGECLLIKRILAIGETIVYADTIWNNFYGIYSDYKVLINFTDDCWIPNVSDANIQIKNFVVSPIKIESIKVIRSGKNIIWRQK